MIWPRGDKDTEAQFKKDLEDVHLKYYYAAENPETGAPESWVRRQKTIPNQLTSLTFSLFASPHAAIRDAFHQRQPHQL